MIFWLQAVPPWLFKLVEKLGGKVVGMVFAMELKFLNGRKTLRLRIHSLIQFDN